MNYFGGKFVGVENLSVKENTHPEIVDPETWETAQKCRQTTRRKDSHCEANPLTGLVFCADCGDKLYNHRQRIAQGQKRNHELDKLIKRIYAVKEGSQILLIQ